MTKEGSKMVSKVKTFLNNMQPIAPLDHHSSIQEAVSQVTNSHLEETDLMGALNGIEANPVYDEIRSQTMEKVKAAFRTENLKGETHIISGVDQEKGITIVICDICNRLGQEVESIHPVLDPKVTKIGITSGGLQDNTTLVAIFFMHEFANSMI